MVQPPFPTGRRRVRRPRPPWHAPLSRRLSRVRTGVPTLLACGLGFVTLGVPAVTRAVRTTQSRTTATAVATSGTVGAIGSGDGGDGNGANEALTRADRGRGNGGLVDGTDDRGRGGQVGGRRDNR